MSVRGFLKRRSSGIPERIFGFSPHRYHPPPKKIFFFCAFFLEAAKTRLQVANRVFSKVPVTRFLNGNL
jgi:hypothetical protein